MNEIIFAKVLISPLFALVFIWVQTEHVMAVNCKFKQTGTELTVELSSPAELTCEESYATLLQNAERRGGNLLTEGNWSYSPSPATSQTLQDSAENNLHKTISRLKDLTKLAKLFGDKSYGHLGLKRLGVDLENEIDFGSEISRLEDEALGIIYAEVSSLTRKLNNTEAKLDLRNRHLNQLNETLRKTQVLLAETSQRLKKAQNSLTKTIEKTKRIEVKARLCETSLEETDRKLLKLQDIHRETQIRLSESNTRNHYLKGRVNYFSSQLNETDRQFRETTLKYNKLTRDHKRVLHLVALREAQLKECLKSKTNQFCGFEHDTICGFTSDTKGAKFNWTRRHGPTPSLRTGPDIDHTCLSERGHYMYIEASARRYGDNARLVSPKYQSVSSQQCIEFYYHMFGHHCGTLSVRIQVQGVQTTPLWRMIGNQGDVWTLARFAVPRQLAMRGYKVVFEGTLERGHQSDIAIDDVKIYDGACPTDNGKIIDMYKFRRNRLYRT